ncbi:secretin N-terminal domain-containing protein [Leptothrix discophora]|uniref:Secretin N-terminal domain-containing protein n=1 Tax=Leptothrix discophora TaxID=89 RepID=A0ABT9G230_LEPDI|nr:secretin N-terminal domain-containing protein [Leptothrix discophora]MDP4300547.1 secretin N-terminal domain-containing protein [Leptothrix discophora]
MKSNFRRPLTRLTLACAVVLSGCAAQRVHDDGLNALSSGRTEQGLQQLRKASELEPGNARYRIDYLSQRALVTHQLSSRADDARSAGQLDDAARLYREALALDPVNERALRGLQSVQDQRRIDGVRNQVDGFLKSKQNEQALEAVRRAQRELPNRLELTALARQVDERMEADRVERERTAGLEAAFKRPVTLQFRDANVKMVFEALSRTANINIILDRDVRADLRTTIYVQNASVEDTLDLILLQNQLDKRVLNGNTLFIYPATAAKQREYNELKVRSFQLSNIEAAQMATIIKTMLKTRDVVTDAKTNSLVMRDTPAAIAVAEKLIAANDVPDPEVMLEVQVLEVSADRTSNLGLKFPDSFTLSTPTTATTLGDLRGLTSNDLSASGLSLGLNLLLQDTDTNILASPRIRARNKEKARILVGDKVPVITNLISPQQNGTNSVITGSVQYVDVGIKLEVEPQVYSDADVGIKINLEVSNIAKTITTASGVAYQIGTRNATTALRLRDGETQVLAGLINDQDRSTASKLPGLGQLPVLGRLFSSTNSSGGKTEIVLSITPRIVRATATPEARLGEVWSGTESTVRDRPLRIDPIGSVRAGAATGGTVGGNAAGAGSTGAAGAGRITGPARASLPTRRVPGPAGGAPAAVAPSPAPVDEAPAEAPPATEEETAPVAQ